MITQHVALVFGLASSVAGCNQQTTQAGTPTPAPAGVLLEVQNSNTQDMKLYIVNDGLHIRIGTAPALETTELPLPVAYAQAALGVELQAEPLGGGKPVRFPPIRVQRDDRVVLALRNATSLSSFAVYPLR